MTRRMSPAPSDVDVVAGLEGAERVEGSGIAGFVPDVPHGAVFRAEAPEGEGLKAELRERRASRSGA